MNATAKTTAVTSRTEIETWQTCKRKWFWRKVYGGMGIVPKFRNVPLASGSAVHKGIETMMLQWLAGKPIDVNAAVKAAKQEYAKQVEDRMLSQTRSSVQELVKREQEALVAGLVRVWHKIELPRLQAEYDIGLAERSISFELNRELRLRFMSKADAILLTKDAQEPIVYSLKTTKEWNERSENSYNCDLQGLTEALGIQEEKRQENIRRKQAIATIRQAYKSGQLSRELATKQLEALGPEQVEQVMGVRFCFLVKGKRWPLWDADGNKAGMWTDSPLLYGYRYVGPGGITYAHSDRTYKPENKSGYGKLGKGWEKFKTYDGGEASKEVGGIKGWLEMLASGEIQPELPNPLEAMVITPTPRFPYREELSSALVQITTEASSAESAKLAYNLRVGMGEDETATLDQLFPQTRRACYWPVECEYLYACYKASPGQNLLDPSSPYEERTPHHDIERELTEQESSEE